MTTNQFSDLLDQAANSLLKQAGLTAPAVGPAPEDAASATADLAEKVKAFTAVWNYAKDRALLNPPKKEPSAIEKMRAELSSGAPAEEKKPRRKKTETDLAEHSQA